MKGWDVRRLGDLLLKTATVDPMRTPDRLFQYVDVSSVSNVSFAVEATQELLGKDAPSRARRHIAAGDVIFATVRPTLQRVAIIPDHLDGAVCSTGYFVMRPSPQLDRTYLFYWLFSESFRSEMEKRQRGASYPAVTDGDIREQVIPLPPLEEQRRIVAMLDEAFTAIAIATANAEKNLANARELFEAAFRERFDHAGNGWQEYRMPDISENWDYARRPVTKSDRVAGNIPYYGASGQVDSVRDHLFDSDLLLISEDGANLLMRTYPIAFSITGKSWVNNHAHILNFNHMPTQRLVEYYLNSISVAPWVSGMAQPKLNQKALNNIPVPLPPHGEREALVAELDELIAEIEALEANQQARLTSLASFKQSFLNRAFSGELTGSMKETIAA